MYILTQRELTALRSALTRAQKKDPVATIAACEKAYRVFESKGYPDCWSNWQRAFDDASETITRETGRYPIGGNPFK